MKKRMGRPPGGATVTLTVHLTPEQYKKVLTLSLTSGMSMTAVVRSMIEKKP